MLPLLLSIFTLAGFAAAHLAAFHEAMYCFNGTTAGQVNYNTNDAVNPLWDLAQSDYWFHHVNNCDQFPPAPGDVLELPAGGSFTVEIAGNRGVTSYSFNGEYATEWTDGQNHTGSTDVLTQATYSSEGCVVDPNIHTQNETMASGTAFAISYNSELSQVTLDNLVVFSVLYNTPWKRVTTYDVPAAMPACPSGGCICAWVWVSAAADPLFRLPYNGWSFQIPNGCGEPNIYMEGFKCTVTNATSTTPVGTPKAPVWCESDQSECVQGPKQIMIWNQLEGNNIEVSGNDLSGMPKSPAYNAKCGFQNGAQNDIFATGTSSKRMVARHKRPATAL
ncbi:hypothetical protein M404DRAFT_888845 [Pisolithus tinctorius Marx 270]|uniref:Lytic polysaccharide monooxygenase n=1 Tax=Pisolithus tinctorius Marx 270 TaxID=870435 RepID=A0A0C3JJH1_PISTI|nr:hypothetical protein M404DRAFT_888845 [Pisolithus tinctorius Marx 270]